MIVDDTCVKIVIEFNKHSLVYVKINSNQATVKLIEKSLTNIFL